MDLKIDPEFQKLIPPLSDEEFAMLKRQLKQDGCRDPLVAWDGVILDGHNRYKICTENNVVFDVHHIDLPDRESAMDWIDRNQIGRRNLSKDDFRLIVGRIYNRTKKSAHRPQKGGQNDHLNPGKTAEALAQEHDISPVSVRRYGKLAETVDQIEQDQPELERSTIIEKAKETARPNKKPRQKNHEKEVAKEEQQVTWALDFAHMAISQLKRIEKKDPMKAEALHRVKTWINEQLKGA
jgi:hypothetical protein